MGKSTGMKHTVLRDGQPLTVAFAVLAYLCGPKGNETETGTALFIKNGEGRNFNFSDYLKNRTSLTHTNELLQDSLFEKQRNIQKKKDALIDFSPRQN